VIRSYKITVKGKVQRVSFRFTAQAQAIKLSLTGFIKNRPNGDVYIEAEGQEEHIYKFIEWCDVGPPKAEVSEVIAEEQDLKNFQTFELRR